MQPVPSTRLGLLVSGWYRPHSEQGFLSLLGHRTICNSHSHFFPQFTVPRPPPKAQMLISTTSRSPPSLQLRLQGLEAFSSHVAHLRGGGGRRNRRRLLACRAEAAQDAPFAAAIGACVLASLAFPASRRGAGAEDGEGEEEDAAMGSTDTRIAVMGIIGFLPYFNWLSWVFAWLDSGRRRYLVYAAVYLAPYLRTNLSLSPDESWLPIASILVGILHIQLEASIRSGDIEGLKFFEEARKLIFPSAVKEKDTHSHSDRESLRKGRRSDRKLPSAHESRENLRKSDIFRKRLDEHDEEKRKKSDWS